MQLKFLILFFWLEFICWTFTPWFLLQANFFLFLSLDDPPVIDTESDLDDSDEDVEKDSGQQISDCDSESIDENPEALLLKPTNVSELHLFIPFLLGNPWSKNQHWNSDAQLCVGCVWLFH